MLAKEECEGNDSECVVCESYHRLPAQQHFGLADVGSPPLGVVLGLRQELDLAAAHCVRVRADRSMYQNLHLVLITKTRPVQHK